MGLLAETFLHPGSGDSAGAVDLPVAREKHTGYPVIFGSSLKGALREVVEAAEGKSEADAIFGKPEEAGSVSVTDARLILLPVRSLASHFRWVTCPYLLERYQRDCELAGSSVNIDIPKVEDGTAAGTKEQEGMIFLEELSFLVSKKEDLGEIAKGLGHLIRHKEAKDRLRESLLVISDGEFAHFAANGLAVNARNVLDDATKTSKNLWYEETIPPDAVFYSLLFSPGGRDAVAEKLQHLLRERPYLRVGGNETVGQGWCTVALNQGGKYGE
jgi:CRISPR-associated protein Cmr4